MGAVISANKMIRKFWYEKFSLRFPDLGGSEHWRVACFVDASFNGGNDGCSHGGHIVFAANWVSGACSLLSWKSNKLKRVARSTLAAEAIACVDGIDHTLVIANLIAEQRGHKIPVVVFTDSASLVDTVYSSRNVLERRLRVDIAFLRELILEKSIDVLRWVPTDKQLADCLTKTSAKASQFLLNVMATNSLEDWVKEPEYAIP